MTRRLRRLSLFTATLLVALLGSASAAFAQPGPPVDRQPYPPGNSAACDKTQSPPGVPWFCQARSFTPGSQVDVHVGSPWDLDFTVTADANGVASARFTIPSFADPGPFQVVFTGPDYSGTFERVATVSGLVIGVGAGGLDNPPAAPGLPTTGLEVSRGLVLAGAALIAGGGLVFAARRRRAAQESTIVR